MLDRLLRSTAISVVALALLASPSLAADIELRLEVLGVAADDPGGRTTLRLEVQNIAAGALRNVDVRPVPLGADVYDRDLWQLGTVPPGETRATLTRVVLDEQSTMPLLWRVDYHDASGVQRQIVVPGSVDPR